MAREWQGRMSRALFDCRSPRNTLGAKPAFSGELSQSLRTAWVPAWIAKYKACLRRCEDEFRADLFRGH
jgi:hypothetical protein